MRTFTKVVSSLVIGLIACIGFIGVMVGLVSFLNKSPEKTEGAAAASVAVTADSAVDSTSP